ncbi:hypothetical protein BC829DRAFT_440517 [Chytridium lagenaria]|nr:hypothetical protein BC829DRAFT_440517 [Chytridium lagenaria]
MSNTEKDAYINAVNTLRRTPSRAGRTSLYMDLIAIHSAAAGYIHMTPLFLPWHRAFLRLYENVLRQINPTVSLPYWDWGSDSPQPILNGTSINQIFGSSNRSLGTRGTATQNYCVRDGFMSGWTASDGGCVTRSYDVRFSVPNQIDVAITIQRTTNWAWFVEDLEYYHNYVHGAVGGSDGMMSWVGFSPNDAIFYFHHANVDRLWLSWQQYNPNSRSDYSGSYSLPNGERVDVRSTDIMPSFNLPISTALVIGQSGQCTSYDTIDRTRINRRSQIEELHQRMLGGSAALLPWMDQTMIGSIGETLERGRKKLGSGKFGTILLPTPPGLQEWFIRRNMGRHLFKGKNTPEEEEMYVRHVRAIEAKIETNRKLFIELLDRFLEENPNSNYDAAFAYALNTLEPVQKAEMRVIE